MQHSGLNEKQVKKMLTFGQGPQIGVKMLKNANAVTLLADTYDLKHGMKILSTKKTSIGTDNFGNNIYLNSEVVVLFENAIKNG